MPLTVERSHTKYLLYVKFSRITTDPERFGGMPCIRDLRFPVSGDVAMLADGMTFDEILTEHPDPEIDGLHEALRYAFQAVRECELPPRPGP
jgi:uncharacterized protein (DUF433 family)